MNTRTLIMMIVLALILAMHVIFAWPGLWKMKDLTRSARRSQWRARVHGMCESARAFLWLIAYRVKPVARMALLAPIMPVLGITLTGTRSPLFFKKVPGGVPSLVDTSRFSGNIFYVDSANANAADDEGHGAEPDKPFATIDYAIGLCTANQGDVILVLPGHAETINTAGGITCDKAGLSILGLGNGEDRPTITIGSTLDTATVLISAIDTKLANMIFAPGNDGVDILIDINADGAIVEDCEIRSDEANAYQFDTGIDINGGANGADRCVIRRNVIRSIAAGAVQAIEIGAVEADLQITDNWILGDYSVAGIHSASILTNCLIARNYIHNVNAADFCVELSAAATGLLVDNRFYADAAATTLDPGSMMCIGNEMVNAIDKSSTPVPTTAGGIMPTGAIGAASFAAGAIDAAAIANDAIDATAIATGAIDADAIADNAIDAGAIAADAITNAKIADNALASEQFALSAGEKTTDGIVVTRATAALPQTAAAAIFTVTGLVLVRRIVGYVTVLIGAVANATKIKGNSTGAGATTDLCATLDINGHVADSRYEITGTFINAMVRTLDVPLALVETTNVVIPPGTIDLDCAGSDGGTGRIRWSITYVPLEAGAQVVAA